MVQGSDMDTNTYSFGTINYSGNFNEQYTVTCQMKMHAPVNLYFVRHLSVSYKNDFEVLTFLLKSVTHHSEVLLPKQKESSSAKGVRRTELYRKH